MLGKTMKQFNWKKILFFILAISYVNWATSFISNSVAEKINDREYAQNQAQKPESKVKVVVASQDAEGVTQDKLDINFLNNLEAYTLERVKVKTKERLVSLGYPDTEVNFTSEATYVQSGKTKLAIVRIKSPNAGNQVHISGIEGAELKRIGCVTTSQTTIPISYGKCGEKIKEVFGSMIGS